MTMSKLSHVRDDGSLVMVDVGAKPATARTARAEARVRLSAPAAEALRAATLPKGDAFAAALKCTRASARAVRAVAGFAPTSTITSEPSARTCESLDIVIGT